MPYQPRVTQGFQTNYAPALANFGAQIGAGIREYQAKEEEKKKNELAKDFIRQMYPDLDDKAIAAGVKSVGAGAVLGVANQMQQAKAQQEALEYERFQDRQEQRYDMYKDSRDFFADQQDTIEDNQRQELQRIETARHNRAMEEKDPAAITTKQRAMELRDEALAKGDIEKANEWQSVITPSGSGFYYEMDGEGNIRIGQGALGEKALTVGSLSKVQQKAVDMDMALGMLEQMEGKITPATMGQVGTILYKLVDSSFLADMGLGSEKRMNAQQSFVPVQEAVVRAIAADERLSDIDRKALIKAIPGKEFWSSAMGAKVAVRTSIDLLSQRRALLSAKEAGVKDPHSLTPNDIQALDIPPRDKFYLDKFLGL